MLRFRASSQWTLSWRAGGRWIRTLGPALHSPVGTPFCRLRDGPVRQNGNHPFATGHRAFEVRFPRNAGKGEGQFARPNTGQIRTGVAYWCPSGPHTTAIFINKISAKPRSRFAPVHTVPKRGRKRSPGGNGGRTSANANGAPSARTTARMGMRGTTSPTIKPARAPITGVRTASPVSVTTSNECALPLPCGMARTRSSRSVYTASPTAKPITGRTSKSIISISTARRPTHT
jgi:hypothetical protein